MPRIGRRSLRARRPTTRPRASEASALCGTARNPAGHSPVENPCCKDSTSLRGRQARPLWNTQLLSGLDLETGEISFGAWSDPESDAARGITELEIVHNQTGLGGAVDIQAGFRPVDRDAVAGPHARLEVHVALVLFRCLLAGDREAKIRVRAVLRG